MQCTTTRPTFFFFFFNLPWRVICIWVEQLCHRSFSFLCRCQYMRTEFQFWCRGKKSRPSSPALLPSLAPRNEPRGLNITPFLYAIRSTPLTRAERGVHNFDEQWRQVCKCCLDADRYKVSGTAFCRSFSSRLWGDPLVFLYIAYIEMGTLGLASRGGLIWVP